ncbi:unnamed protein product [Protopolystoma xenopodis]|uniref:protein-serine/threonine phosphatase n=1 Tax=Protopolystoma xenopodis TaxID=117903 RepID=A0A3S5B174_9PLAT|nr:unnamed protein product [Protopolystoma xenopodis]
MQHTTKQFLRQSILRRLDGLVSRLTDYQVLKGKPAQIAEHEISNICWLVSEVFLEDPVFIEIRLTPSLYIIGDIYGQYCDLLRIFNVLGHPPNQKYLFLGNLIDRGSRSIETLTLLMAYKLLYPHHIYLLRGKHECEYVSKQYGFYEECTKRFSCRLWRSIVSAFDYMPLMASIEDRIFCSSGGLSPMLEFSGVRTLNDFKVRSNF